MQIFHATPLILCGLCSLASEAPFSAHAEPDRMPLFRFEDPASVAPWRPHHDVVMGGVSSGTASWKAGAVRFSGVLSLENGGGFASLRAPAPVADLSNYDGVWLRARGDGRGAQLGLRCSGSRIRWRAPFATTAGEWTSVFLSFSDLTPTFHGRLVAKAEPLDLEALEEVEIVVADGRAAAFTLEVSAIDAWRIDEQQVSQPGSRASALSRTRTIGKLLDGGADAETLVGHLRWTERLLVVAEPAPGGDLGAPASCQIGRFLACDAALADRELRVVRLVGERGGRIAGRTLSPAAVRALRARWKLASDQWAVALVGKDGGVKAAWQEPIEPSTVFVRIDAMPMRSTEVRGRR